MQGLAITTPRRAGEAVAHSTAFEVLARGGFLARATIYAIIGTLAIKVAVGSGGKTTNQQGALETIAHQPFGRVLLILTAFGLGSYALWRFTRAALDHGPEEALARTDRWSLRRRMSFSGASSQAHGRAAV